MIGLDACPETLPGVRPAAPVLRLVPEVSGFSSNVCDCLADLAGAIKDRWVVSVAVVVLTGDGEAFSAWTRTEVPRLRGTLAGLGYRMDQWTYE